MRIGLATLPFSFVWRPRRMSSWTSLQCTRITYQANVTSRTSKTIHKVVMAGTKRYSRDMQSHVTSVSSPNAGSHSQS